MNIVHLLSQHQLTGAEVYACQLISEQADQGHSVFQISNGFYFPTLAKKIELAVETDSSLHFIKSVLKLRSFLKENNIHIIHSHSRAAAKLAYYATFCTQVAHVSTIHGRQHASFSKKIINHYGQFQIPVCENIQTQLIQEFKYNSRQIKLIRNGIDRNKFFFKKLTANSPQKILRIAIIGRLSGPKKERTFNFLKTLSQIKSHSFDTCYVDIIGSEKVDLNLDFQLSEKIQLHFTQHVDLNSSFYQNYDLIVGSGRVCVEAILSGVATIAFGEARYHGLIRKENYHEFISTNFGDIASKDFGSPSVNSDELIQALEELHTLKHDELTDLTKLAVDDFDLKKINKQITKIYEMAILNKIHPHWIPILMYHKIPDQDLHSPHKIYVNKRNFEKHLRFFAKMGFQTLTFNELNEFSKGLKSATLFPQKPLILTFDDGYEDNLEHAAPLLKKYNFKAQIFLLADQNVSYNQWDESDPQKGDAIINGHNRTKWINTPFEIGSHGLKHDRITQMKPPQALNELTQSKQQLETEFKQPVSVFAYTYGDTNNQAAQLAEKAGYDFAVNTDTGGLTLMENPYQIFRVNIFPNETTLSLWKKTSKWYRKYYFKKRKQ